MTDNNQIWTQECRTKLEDYLQTHKLPSGLGTKESACSIAAINLAITGELTAEIPDCMSKVLGKATIAIQDAMPDKLRNSARYKALLIDMPGTGRNREQRRMGVITAWMWDVVLPQLQDIADEKGFGKKWRHMCEQKSEQAAYAAAYVADVAADAAAYVADAAAYVADAAAYAADAAADAAAYAAARAAARAADAAADAAAYAAAYAAADAADFWVRVDPIGVLERMTYIDGERLMPCNDPKCIKCHPYPYTHLGPAVHGSKLEDYLISEANMIEAGILPASEPKEKEHD